MPRGVKGSGVKAPRKSSYADMAGTLANAAATHDFTKDPEFQKVKEEEKAAEAALDAEVEKELDESEERADSALDHMGDDPKSRHEFANGSTIPLPYDGVDTNNYTTCSRNSPTNRGCSEYPNCSIRGLGPKLLVFEDRKTKQIRHETCIHFLKTGMVKNPRYTLVPLNWHGTLMPEYGKLPDGRPTMPGPGQPKGPIKMKPVKNYIPDSSLLTKEQVRDYQRLRRRGEV